MVCQLIQSTPKINIYISASEPRNLMKTTFEMIYKHIVLFYCNICILQDLIFFITSLLLCNHSPHFSGILHQGINIERKTVTGYNGVKTLDVYSCKSRSRCTLLFIYLYKGCYRIIIIFEICFSDFYAQMILDLKNSCPYPP